MKSPQRKRKLHGGKTLQQIFQDDDVAAFQTLWPNRLDVSSIPRKGSRKQESLTTELLNIAVAYQSVKIVEFLLKQNVPVSKKLGSFFDANDFTDGGMSTNLLKILKHFCRVELSDDLMLELSALTNGALTVANTKALHDFFVACPEVVNAPFQGANGETNLLSRSLQTGAVNLEFLLRHGANPNMFFVSLPRFAMFQTTQYPVLSWLNMKNSQVQTADQRQKIYDLAEILVQFGASTSVIEKELQKRAQMLKADKDKTLTFDEDETDFFNFVQQLSRQRMQKAGLVLFVSKYRDNEIVQKPRLPEVIEQQIQNMLIPIIWEQRRRENLQQERLQRKRLREEMERASSSSSFFASSSSRNLAVVAKGAGAGNETTRANVGASGASSAKGAGQSQEKEEDKENQSRPAKRPRK